MKKIIIDDCVYSVHPIYNLYAASKDGNIIHIIKQVPHEGNKTYTGYMMCSVRKHGQSGQKSYKVHRFIWECFNGIIPSEMQIDHINDVKDDNRLSNLQLLTPSENSKKSVKNRYYSFVKDTHKNRKCVRATNKDTGEITYFYSMYATQQHLAINHLLIKRVCENQKYYKSVRSKKDGHYYTFQYVKQEDLPQNYINPKI